MNQTSDIPVVNGPAESYTLTAREAPMTRELFLNFLGRLRERYGPDSVIETGHSYTVTIYGNGIFTAELRGSGPLTHVKIVAARSAFHAIYAMRETARQLEISVKHDASGLPLPADPNLVPPYLCVQAAKFNAVLKASPFELAYCETDWDERVRTIYVKLRESGQIHLVNLGVFGFFIEHDDFEASDEFSYEVAASATEFTAKADAHLIPTDFYKYFRTSSKIINYSSFDIDHIDRKVFIAPLVYEIDRQNHNLNILAGGGTLADKVRSRETLDEAIKRVLRDELKVADDYIGATVYRHVEFDRDRDNLLTPRLRLDIYIENGQASETTRRTAQRGWRSLGKDNA